MCAFSSFPLGPLPPLWERARRSCERVWETHGAELSGPRKGHLDQLVHSLTMLQGPAEVSQTWLRSARPSIQSTDHGKEPVVFLLSHSIWGGLLCIISELIQGLGHSRFSRGVSGSCFSGRSVSASPSCGKLERRGIISTETREERRKRMVRREGRPSGGDPRGRFPTSSYPGLNEYPPILLIYFRLG